MLPPMGRASSGLGALALLLLATTGAAAQGADNRARLHFESGTAYYDAGDYEDALREFQNAYELSERPGLLYNLYLCHERLANLPEAIAALERYLAEGDPGERREVLETRLGNLRERQARVESGAVTEAEAEAETEAEAEAQAESVDAGTGTHTGDEPRGGSSIPTPAIVSLGITGAGALTWAIFGILAASEDGSLSGGCAAAGTCTEDDVSSLRTFNVVADIGFAVTIAGAAATALLWLLLDSDGGEETRAAIAPYLNESGGGFVAAGRL